MTAVSILPALQLGLSTSIACGALCAIAGTIQHRDVIARWWDSFVTQHIIADDPYVESEQAARDRLLEETVRNHVLNFLRGEDDGEQARRLR